MSPSDDRGGDAKPGVAVPFGMISAALREYAVVTLDVNGVVTGWNPGAARNTGHFPADVIGQPGEIFCTKEQIAAGRPQWVLGYAKITRDETESHDRLERSIRGVSRPVRAHAGRDRPVQRLEGQLRQAIDSDDLVLRYQPIVTRAGCSPAPYRGRSCGISSQPCLCSPAVMRTHYSMNVSDTTRVLALPSVVPGNSVNAFQISWWEFEDVGEFPGQHVGERSRASS